MVIDDALRVDGLDRGMTFTLTGLAQSSQDTSLL
jgi:hypothetical protein